MVGVVGRVGQVWVGWGVVGWVSGVGWDFNRDRDGRKNR